jgi:hypothetical protein
LYWVVPEKIHTPPTEEISAVRRGRGEKIVSDNSKCIRTSEGGRGLTSYFLCGVVWMFSGMTHYAWDIDTFFQKAVSISGV